MQITHSFGHVNDLRNIRVKEAALKQAKADLEHFRDDVRCGRLPYEDTITKAIERINAAMGE